jgi:periplasmic protein TonB
MASSAYSSTAPTGPAYQLSDDLARLCLPQEFKDSYRNLAWVNSICVLFLLVGLIGLKAPRVIVRPIQEPVEPQMVVLQPPEEQVKPEKLDTPEEQTPDEVTVDTEVTPVISVVAAETPGVQFSVPVKVLGPVTLAASAAAATAPPANNVVSAPAPQPQATKFNPTAEGTTGGYYPKPDYPKFALKNKYQGAVTIDIKVEPSGQITSVTLQKASGYGLLDEAALEVVKERWRFPPGGKRWYYWNFEFKMN